MFVVLMEDEIAHDDAHPLCSDPTYLCHDDANLVREFITQPLDNGLMTNSEALRLFWGKQLGAPQEEAIAETMTGQPLRIAAQFQQQMDRLLLEHD